MTSDPPKSQSLTADRPPSPPPNPLRAATARVAFLLGLGTCAMGIVFVLLTYSNLTERLPSNRPIPWLPLVIIGAAYLLPGIFLAWSGAAIKEGSPSGPIVAIGAALWLALTTLVAIAIDCGLLLKDNNLSDTVIPRCIGNAALLLAALVLSIQAIRLLANAPALDVPSGHT